MHRIFRKLSLVLPSLSVAIFSTLVGLSSTAHAQTAATRSTGLWEVSVGAAVVSASEWEGAKRRVSTLAPDLNVSYKTSDWGTFALGSRSRGLSWAFIESKDYSLGVALSTDSGRRAGVDGTVFRPGSTRLRGMGDIKSSGELVVFGQANVGVPIGLRYSRNVGDGKVDAVAFSQAGHGGSKFELNVDLPYQVSQNLTISASPSLTWADRKYTQAVFGVTAAQSSRSGFKAFTTGSGIKDLSLSLDAQLTLDKQWSASLNVALSSLRGDAANSSIVERKSSASVAAGLNHRF